MHGNTLDTLLAHLSAVAALTSAGRLERLREAAALARRDRVATSELREAVLVSALFGGFPRAVAAQGVLNEVLGPPDGGSAEPSEPLSCQQLRERGVGLFRRIHGPRAEPQLQMLGGFPEAFTQGILGEAYGRVMAREVLPLRTRELLAVAALSVLGLPRVLRAHLLAARWLGASPECLSALLGHVSELCELDGEALQRVLRGVLRATRGLPVTPGG